MKLLARPTFIAMALVATAAMVVVLALALQPKPRPRGKLPSVDIAELAPGAVQTLDSGSLRYFILRPLQGDVYVLAAPFENNAVPLPEVHWWKPFMHCKNFGLVGERVTPDAQFACRDQDLPESWKNSWRWNVQGRNTPRANAATVDHMYRVEVQRDDDELTFVGLDTD